MEKVPNLDINGCVLGYRVPKKIQLFSNKEFITEISPIADTSDNNCDFYFQHELLLEKGLNEVEIRITDYKNFQFSGYRTIYLIPPPTKIW